jgi:cyclopropane fatty-acyl-phospholipid synthase-like methyltransferase
MGLELYAKIESYLEFEDEVKQLHKEFLGIIFEKDLDNILDVGCGQGAFLNHLKANAKTAVGIDLSVEQIKVCRSFCLDASAMPLSGVTSKYDCLTAIFDVINYISKNELEKFFKDTHQTLNDHGYFIFDSNSLFGFEEIAQGSLNINTDEKFIAIDSVFEDEKLKTDITLFSRDKKNLYIKEQDSVTQYYHSTKHLKDALKNANFTIERILNFNMHTDDEADKLIFICKK